jgi:Rps23 Pro-64 3,4-dihydroxylase Tpa1-like proline 4-hydroxylase
VGVLTASSSIRLAPGHDPRVLRPIFARAGRLHIPQFLTPEAAEAITRDLEAKRDWSLSVVTGGRTFETAVAALDALGPDDRRELDAATADGRADHMQYRFDTWRVSFFVDQGQRRGGAVEALYDFLNARPFLDFVAGLTGDPRGTFCDAQATRYRPGSFLTRHNDAAPERNRLYAYVLNFSREWRPDWGGLLQFYAADGHVDEAYTPAFNALNIFRVPMDHAVSYVAPYAAADRLSVTGWVRMGSLPKARPAEA